MMSASSRFFTGKLTMVGFFSRKNWFFMKRFMCSTRNFGSLVNLQQQASQQRLWQLQETSSSRATTAAEQRLGQKMPYLKVRMPVSGESNTRWPSNLCSRSKIGTCTRRSLEQ